MRLRMRLWRRRAPRPHRPPDQSAYRVDSRHQAKSTNVITLSDRAVRRERAPSRLIVTEVDVAAFAVAFRGPMGWLPNRLPTALARSGFRSRCRALGTRSGVART